MPRGPVDAETLGQLPGSERFGPDDILDVHEAKNALVDFVNLAAEYFVDLHGLEVTGYHERGLEVFADGNDHLVHLPDSEFLEYVNLHGVTLDGVRDLVLDRLHAVFVLIDSHDFMPLAAELDGEICSEMAEADNTIFHSSS